MDTINYVKARKQARARAGAVEAAVAEVGWR